MTSRPLPPLPTGIDDSARAHAANLLHTTVIHVLRTAAADDRELGLTSERLSLLSVLVFAGPLPVGRIAEIEGISPAAVSRSVSGLEALGLVAKSRDSDDGRVVTVSATPAGRRLLDRGRRRRLARLVALLEPLGAAELAGVSAACETLRTLVTQAPAPSSTR